MSVRQFLSQAAKLLYLGVGISDPGTIPRKIDLWQIAEGNGWQVRNLSTSNLNYKGKEAVRLAANGRDGLALLEGLELDECKLDLSIAVVNQSFGLLVRAKNENSFDVVSFAVDAAAGKLAMSLGERSTEVELPQHLLGEWVGVRVVVAQQFTAVFVAGNNMPSLKVATNGQTANGEIIGFKVGSGSEALVADLKYIQTRKHH